MPKLGLCESVCVKIHLYITPTDISILHPLSLCMQGGYMSPDHISLAHSLLYSLLDDIRREAVPLVDAFDVPDEILNSALGRYDGDVYRHLYEWAQRAPRNRKKVGVPPLKDLACDCSETPFLVHMRSQGYCSWVCLHQYPPECLCLENDT